MLRIMHVLVPAPFGGLESVVETLARAQAKRACDVHVVLVVEPHAREHSLVSALDGSGVSVHPVAVSARGYARERSAVRELARRIRPDIVHTHGYRADLLHGSCASRAGAASVTTLHGFCGGDWKNRLYESLQRRIVRRFDGVVAVSRTLADQLSRDGQPRDRLHVVVNAFPVDTPFEGREEARRTLGLNDASATPVIGFIGRLGREKGPDLFVEAIARLPLPARALMVGDGAMRTSLELAANDGVRFSGAIPAAGRLLRAFDLLVLSSRTEGTPMVLLEAMAAGTPVVASRVGGIPDVVGEDEAFLVEPEDAAALARSIELAVRHPDEAARRALNASRRLREHYAVDAWVDRYHAVYRHCLAQRQTKS